MLSISSKGISKFDQYVMPWSICGLAEIKLYQGDRTAAAELFKKAKRYTGYDYESWVAWRVKRGMDRIRGVW